MISAEANFRRNLIHLVGPNRGATTALANATGISVARMGRLLRGARLGGRPTLEEVGTIAKALQVDPGDLAFGRLDLGGRS